MVVCEAPSPQCALGSRILTWCSRRVPDSQPVAHAPPAPAPAGMSCFQFPYMSA
uniref:Uncharacterized protein n=1 Tax=Arundo donax TaxID=35708 RepID=A0A0A8Y8K0_ARUDO